MTTRILMLTCAIALSAGAAQAAAFNRIASFMVAENAPDAEASSAEIIAATGDGMMLVYTDSPAAAVGFIDISNPSAPAAAGIIALEGEPTAVAVAGMTAYVGENLSDDYVNVAGALHAIDVQSQEVLETCDLGGQPDSVAVSPDGSFVAVAIENERDEDFGDGRVGQAPGGFVTITQTTTDGLDCSSTMAVDIMGLAEIAPDDPEPEFVAINGEGEIVVTLQENNHIVVISAAGDVLSDFSAGEVTLEGVDTEEEGALIFTETITVPREPDAITWIDDTHFAMANEGDMDGGSRGWTIFSQDGEVIYEAGASFEHAIIEVGHYPEERSGNKGVEPESVTFGVFDGTPMVFVGAERSSIVGVYDVSNPAEPVLAQLLPSGIGPEGYAVIPERNLLVSANEVDDAGPRAHVMLFEYQEGVEPTYPHLTSAGMAELTGWGAISGQVMAEDGTIYAVSDSFYGMQPTIFHIDVSQMPARIVDAIRVTRDGQPAQLMDMEGIALDGEGGFWVASEGRSDRLVPHAIYHVGGDGALADYIPLPPELLAVERRFGFEGVTRVDDMLYLVVQREWADDPENHAKVLGYNLESEEWSVIHYPLTPAETGWVGLSEIVAHDGFVYFIERDNQFENAATKQITRVPLEAMDGMVALGETPAVLEPELVVDLLPFLTSMGGYILDKVEGLAIAADGTMWVSTDNDGVDDHSGETLFFAVRQ
ncbi:MAG: esterase-like activity of phytase family protein [Pseudomonadota bacterium]